VNGRRNVAVSGHTKKSVTVEFINGLFLVAVGWRFGVTFCGLYQLSRCYQHKSGHTGVERHRAEFLSFLLIVDALR